MVGVVWEKGFEPPAYLVPGLHQVRLVRVEGEPPNQVQVLVFGDTVARVLLFRQSGKYYTEEKWRIPPGAIGPYDMGRSPDFHRIGGSGPVLIPTQEPWGFPHLFPGVPS